MNRLSYLEKMPPDILDKIGHFYPVVKDDLIFHWTIQNVPDSHDLFQLIVNINKFSDEDMELISDLTDFPVEEFIHYALKGGKTRMFQRLEPISIKDGISKAIEATQKFTNHKNYIIKSITHDPPEDPSFRGLLTHIINIYVGVPPQIYPIANTLNVLSKTISKNII